MWSEKWIGFLVRRRTKLLGAVPIALLLVAHPTVGLYALGVCLIALGQAVRFWASGHIRKQEQLATSGPYAYVRHPLYLGSLLINLGWGAMVGRAEWAALLVVAYFLTHWPTMQAEERFLRQRFGAEYEDYCRRVPRLLPRLRPQERATQSFSWQLAFEKNHEGRNATWVVLLLLAYGIRLWW